MSEHRLHISRWRLRGAYRDLRRDYAELARRYRELSADHQALLADLAGEPVPVEEPELRHHVPSWAQTTEIPVITDVGLDPDKTDALVRRGGLLDDPSGEWRVVRPESG